MKKYLSNEFGTRFPYFLFPVILIFLFPSLTLAQHGSIDSTFGINGVFTKSTSKDVEDLLVMSNNKILIGSNSKLTGKPDALLLRLNPGGTIDSSFNIDGRLHFTIDSNKDATIDRLYLQSDGKILVNGSIKNESRLYLLRLNPDGTRDNSFGNNGEVIYGFNNNEFKYAKDLDVTTNGDIITIGATSTSDNEIDVLINKFKQDGSVDSSFRTNGYFTIDELQKRNAPSNIQLTFNNHFIIAYNIGISVEDVTFRKYDESGILDSSFADDGIYKFPANKTFPSVPTFELDQNEDIIIQGGAFRTSTSSLDIVFYKLLKNGKLDNTFGNNGQIFIDNNNYHDFPVDITIDKEGGILMLTRSGGGSTPESLSITRILNGMIDTSFGFNGMVNLQINGKNTSPGVISMHDNNKILVGGSFDGNIFLIRFLQDLDFSSSSHPRKIKSLMKVYPNPAKNFISIESDKNFNYQILDINGRSQLSGEIRRKNSHIDISSLANGIYFIFSEETELVGKFLKN